MVIGNWRSRSGQGYGYTSPIMELRWRLEQHALLVCGMVAAKRKEKDSKGSARAEVSGRWIAPSTGDSKRTARGGQSVTPHGRFLYIIGGRYLLKGCVERGTVAIGWDPCR